MVVPVVVLFLLLGEKVFDERDQPLFAQDVSDDALELEQGLLTNQPLLSERQARLGPLSQGGQGRRSAVVSTLYTQQSRNHSERLANVRRNQDKPRYALPACRWQDGEKARHTFGLVHFREVAELGVQLVVDLLARHPEHGEVLLQKQVCDRLPVCR